jgi:hypothetical protein
VIAHRTERAFEFFGPQSTPPRSTLDRRAVMAMAEEAVGDGNA